MCCAQPCSMCLRLRVCFGQVSGSGRLVGKDRAWGDSHPMPRSECTSCCCVPRPVAGHIPTTGARCRQGALPQCELLLSARCAAHPLLAASRAPPCPPLPHVCPDVAWLPAGCCLLLVVHGGVLHALYKCIVGRPFGAAIANASTHVIRVDGPSMVVLQWNACSVSGARGFGGGAAEG